MHSFPPIISMLTMYVTVHRKSGTTWHICDRLQENRAERGVRKYREKIDRFLKNVLFQADGREQLGLL